MLLHDMRIPSCMTLDGPSGHANAQKEPPKDEHASCIEESLKPQGPPILFRPHL